MIPGRIKKHHLALVVLISALSHLLKLDKGFYFLSLANKPSELSQYI